MQPDQSALDGIVARVCERCHADVVVAARTAIEIFELHYAEARIQSFIPILVEKELRERLRGLEEAG